MFQYNTTVKLHDTDAAGVLFFSNQFKIIHDAYQSFLESIGFGFAKLIRESEFSIPIVHAEADYKRPVFVDDQICIELDVKQVGESSFALSYTLLDEDKNIIGTATTVHVTTDKKSRRKVSLPDPLRELLKKCSSS